MSKNIEFELRQSRYGLLKTVEILFNKKTEDRIALKVPFQSIIDQIDAFIPVVLKGNRHIISSVFRTDSFDEYTLGHSLNVCMLSILIGDSLGYGKEDLAILGTAALLHDIGKRETPDAIIFKEGKLTKDEVSIIKKHPAEGYAFMERVYPGTPDVIKEAILTHHERLDGSGYPLGIKNVPPMARIIAVADVYEAYTSLRSYHKKRAVAEGIKCIRETPGLDTDIVRTFTEKTVFYPHGSYVILSDGAVAMIHGDSAGENPTMTVPGTKETLLVGNREIKDLLTPSCAIAGI